MLHVGVAMLKQITSAVMKYCHYNECCELDILSCLFTGCSLNFISRGS